MVIHWLRMWQLYKYQPVNKLVLSNLVRGQLWYSKPAAFNDPFEFRLQRNGTARGIRELRVQNPHLSTATDAELVEKATDLYENAIRSMGVCCFTEVPDSVLMWSHYAASHTGICLGFCGDEGRSESDDALYRVSYDDRYPSVDFSNVWDREGLAKVLWTKEKAWRHEREWRSIVTEGDQLREYHGSLNRVVFGLRTAEGDRELVRSILADKSIDYFCIVRDESRYRLHLMAI